MTPKTIFITGANRGIGLGIVRELLKLESVETVIAGARNVDGAQELRNLEKTASGRLHLLKVDVADDESLKTSVKKVEEVVGERGLDLLINNAGMIESYKTDDTPNRKAILNCIDVNAVSSLLASQYFTPLLRQGAAHSAKPAAIVNIGSDCSSQELNVKGACNNNRTLVAYKMSKVAMLSFARSLVADFETLGVPVLVTTIHPGWVATDMGGADADITVDESASDIVRSIGRLDSTHTGGLFDRKLNKMPF